MRWLPFIFSNLPHYRLSRHLSFWLVALFGLGTVGLGVRPLFRVEVSQGSIREHVFEPLLYLPGQLFLVYSLLYWAIPRYLLRAKYRQALLAAVLLSILGGFVAAISYDLLRGAIYNNESIFSQLFYRVNGARSVEITPLQLADAHRRLADQLPFDFFSGLQAVLYVAGFAAALKLAKYWYDTEYRNSLLQKEKMAAELQSLKAQLHPHFLFNTLNNIYSITENSSPLASGMLVKLSAILRYILYECDRPLVPLSQEFTMIRDYLDLEQVRYSALDLNTHFPAETNGYRIAPLLLLPLVENCFKHGSSRLVAQPWINIDANLRGDALLIKLINGKPATASVEGFTEGIGLANVRKRLDLLYPGRYELSVFAEPEVFVVNLKLQLEDPPAASLQ